MSITTNKKQLKSIEIIWICFLIIFTITIGLLLQNNFDASSFIYDASLYLNVVNNLRESNEFSIVGTFPVGVFNEASKKWEASNSPIVIMDNYPEIKRSYGKPPLYFLSLAGFLELVSADFTNWIFFSALFNTLISVGFIIAYYYFCKKHFRIEIAIFSSFLLATSTIFILSTTDTRMYGLTFFFIILAFSFLKNTKKNYLLFGIFSGLASLTHPYGILGIVSYGLYLIYKREGKGMLIVLGTWFSFTIPWMSRQLQVFGDFGKSMGIPFSEKISSFIFRRELSDPLDKIVKEGIKVETPFEMIYSWLFTPGWWDFNQDLIVIFGLFSILSILNLKKFKGIHVSYINLILVGIIFYLLFEPLDPTLQLILLMLIPILALIILKIKGKMLEEQIPRLYIVIGFLIVVTMFAQYHATNFISVAQPLLGFPMLILLLPLGLNGIIKLFSNIPKLDKVSKKIPYLIIGVICVSSAIIIIPATFDLGSKVSSQDDEDESREQTFSWIRDNINRNAVIMHRSPSFAFLGTGNPVVSLVTSTNEPYAAQRYVEYYNVEYLLTGTTNFQIFDIENRLGLRTSWFDSAFERIYKNGSYSFYKINYSKILEPSWLIYKGAYLERTGQYLQAFENYELYLKSDERIINKQSDFLHVHNMLLSMGWKSKESNVLEINTGELTPQRIKSEYKINDLPPLKTKLEDKNENSEENHNNVIKQREQIIEKLIGEFDLFEDAINLRAEEARKLGISGKYFEALRIYDELDKIDPVFFKLDILELYEKLSEDEINNSEMKKRYSKLSQELIEALKDEFISSEYKKEIKELIIKSFKAEVSKWKESENLNKLSRVYEEWISYDSFNRESRLGYAQTLEELGETKRAISAYEFVLKITPIEEQEKIKVKIEFLKNNL